jgi:hypothetical protein
VGAVAVYKTEKNAGQQKTEFGKPKTTTNPKIKVFRGFGGLFSKSPPTGFGAEPQI